MNPAATPLNVIILMPVFNDWESAEVLVQQLDRALADLNGSVQVLFVDDYSRSPVPGTFGKLPLHKIERIESLRLHRNLGHQRAIAIGLTFIHEKRACDAVVVMDADGEDRPEDVPRLVAEFLAENREKVIFAARARRSEHLGFRLGYFAYRWLHRILTGISVRVGNFSIVPFKVLETLSVVAETWNHYAASVFKARLPYTMLPTNRGTRIQGRSSLNLISLVVHGLSAISVYAETVGVRLTLGIGILSALMLLLLVLVVGIRLGTDLAIPGWASTAAGLILVVFLQMLTVAIGLTLFVLFSRNNLSFLPARDYAHFVGKVHTVYERQG